MSAAPASLYAQPEGDIVAGSRASATIKLPHAVRLDPSQVQNLFSTIMSNQGIKVDPAQMQSMFSHMYSTRGQGFTHGAEDDFVQAAPEPTPSPPIIKHLRGDVGIDLPKKGEFPFPAGPQATISQEQMRKAAEIGYEQLKEVFAKAQELPALPECSNSYTKKVSTGVPGKDKDEYSILDLLFIADDIPSDVQEIFGDYTMVIKYETFVNNPMAVLARRFQVDCLPYRIRITNQHMMRHQGIDALLNYDSNPDGKGTMHAYVKAKYGKRF